MVGSSPLARGLLFAGKECFRHTGIIPARAGFTWATQARAQAPAGSSPLARGLQVLHVTLPQPVRIIPARAGFTIVGLPVVPRSPDHPRSRGVYPSRRRQPFLPRGSSPLARGLRSGRGPDTRRLRIIPARAGFTSSLPRGRPIRRDHPRSRGVYHGRVDGVGLFVGIIPARAGFTRIPFGHAMNLPDHPRSRGVYQEETSWVTARPGSSPLARGLRARSD